jgi:alanine racemase
VDLRPEHSTWLEIDLEAIRRNARRLAELCGVQVMAVVKAGAYGHGGAPAARATLRGGVDWLGTARVEEALELRREGIEAPILVLGATPAERVRQALEADLRLTAWSDEQLQPIAAAGRRARVHLKIDSGMNRIGVQPEEALDWVRRATAIPNLTLEGAYTHFARADEADKSPTRRQHERFAAVIESLDSAGLRPPLLHACNTAGALSFSEARWGLVRSGVGIYGLHPSSEVRLPDAFEPALSWKAVVTQVKAVPAGQGVSYGHAYVTRGEERLATLAVGYADGFRRVDGNEVLLGGRRVPVVGRVCMDQCLVRLAPGQEVRAGDEAVLLGRQGGERISAEEIAVRWGTINYEVTCGITERVVRAYR